MFDDRQVQCDAEQIPAPPPDAPRVNPRKTLVWIRVGGRWLPGHIQNWFRLEDGGWGLWGCYQADPDHPTVAPRWRNWRFDPRAFADRERHPEPPEG